MRSEEATLKAVMMGNLYDALIKAGADGEGANFDLRASELETHIDCLEIKMDARFATLTWMVGVRA